jgi:hypothetical protein
MTSEIVHPPEFRADITRVQYGLAVTFDQKHNGANTMVRVEQSDAYRPPRRQVNDRGSLERDSLEQFLEMFVCLLASFQYPFGEVHAVRVFFKAQQDFFRCWRAVDEGRFAELQAFEVVGVDMAEEVRQWRCRCCFRIGGSEMVDAYVREFFHFAVEGRHVSGERAEVV